MKLCLFWTAIAIGAGLAIQVVFYVVDSTNFFAELPVEEVLYGLYGWIALCILLVPISFTLKFWEACIVDGHLVGREMTFPRKRRLLLTAIWAYRSESSHGIAFQVLYDSYGNHVAVPSESEGLSHLFALLEENQTEVK